MGRWPPPPLSLLRARSRTFLGSSTANCVAHHVRSRPGGHQQRPASPSAAARGPQAPQRQLSATGSDLGPEPAAAAGCREGAPAPHHAGSRSSFFAAEQVGRRCALCPCASPLVFRSGPQTCRGALAERLAPIPRLPQRRHGPDGDEPDRPDRPGGDGPGERALQAPGRPPPPLAPHLRALVIRPIVRPSPFATTGLPLSSAAHCRANDHSTLPQNLALNVAEKGFTISVYNRSGDKTDAAVARAKKEGVGERLHGEQHSCDLALVSTSSLQRSIVCLRCCNCGVLLLLR